jgi:hypothetical protein
LDLTDYLWVPFVLAVFIIVPTVVIAFKRFIVFVFRKLTGRDKLEAAQREAVRAEYANPDWRAYTAYLLREPPANFKVVHDSGILIEKPIVRVDGEEYWLYPVQDNGVTQAGIWPLGQNELGEPLFLKPGVEPSPLFLHELGPDVRELASDADAFFRRVVDQNRSAA